MSANLTSSGPKPTLTGAGRKCSAAVVFQNADVVAAKIRHGNQLTGATACDRHRLWSRADSDRSCGEASILLIQQYGYGPIVVVCNRKIRISIVVEVARTNRLGNATYIDRRP